MPSRKLRFCLAWEALTDRRNGSRTDWGPRIFPLSANVDRINCQCLQLLNIYKIIKITIYKLVVLYDNITQYGDTPAQITVEPGPGCTAGDICEYRRLSEEQ